MLETLPETGSKEKDRVMDPCGMKFASLNNILLSFFVSTIFDNTHFDFLNIWKGNLPIPTHYAKRLIPLNTLDENHLV
jgi:hypothetical protein